MKENNIDIMAVSEVEITKTSYHYDQLYHISGYNLIYPQSWSKCGKARIICYHKVHLEPHIKLRPGLSPHAQPVIWLEIDTLPCFLVCFIYREWTSLSGDKTPAGQKFRFKEFLSKASSVAQKEVIVMGDVNIDGKLLDEDHSEDSLPGLLKDFMLERGFSQQIKQPTRARVVNGVLEESLLDHVLTNTESNVHNIKITKMSNSDHDIISMERRTLAPPAVEPVTVRSLKKFVADDFVGSLREVDWDNLDETATVDEAVDFLNAAVLNSLDRLAPKITFTPKTQSNPTLKKETISTIRDRNRTDITAKKTKDPVDIAIWRSLRNRVVGMIRRDSKAATDLFCSSPKNTWKALNQLTRTNKANHGTPSMVQVGNEMVTDKQKMADSFNDFFISKVVKLRESIKNMDQPFDPINHLRNLLPSVMPPLDLKTINVRDVSETLLVAKNTKSVGPDEISFWTLKIGAPVLAEKLSRIFNRSLRLGVFPAQYRQALVVPLHKKKSKTDMANYRNISLVSKQALIFEKIIHKQICNHFSANSLFSPSQHAYIEGRSTASLCTSIYDRACRAAQMGKYARILSCDLKSGFDVISGQILADKLHYGFKTSVETDKWLRSYLSSRFQQVKLGETI